MIVLVALAVVASPALALESHAFSSAIGSHGSEAGQLSLGAESGVAFMNATGPDAGEVFVADTGNHRIAEFDPAKPAGEQFVRAWGWGVRTGAAELQVCTSLSGCQAGLKGSSPGEFEAPNYVAVDESGGASNGDVYVADRGDNLIQKFDPEGNLVTDWGNGGVGSSPNGQLAINRLTNPPSVNGTGSVGGIGVDSSGDLVVSDTNGNTLAFSPEGSYLPASSYRHEYASGLPGAEAVDEQGNIFFIGTDGTVLTQRNGSRGLLFEARGRHTGIAIDPSTDDLFADSGSAIEHYPPPCTYECEFTDSFGAGRLSAAAGLALVTRSGELQGDIFAANVGNETVDVFSPIVIPDLSDQPASEIHPSGATLNGSVDPAGGGEVTECEFEYVSKAAFEKTGFSNLSSGGVAPCEQALPITSPTAVSAKISGLYTETAYRYRLAAANASGRNTGSSRAGVNFTTLASAEAVTGEVTDLLPTSATLNATVDPNGHSPISDCHFEYVKATFTAPYDFSSATSVPCEQPTPLGSRTAASAALAGLHSASVYQYRVVVTNAEGTTLGPGRTFSTPSHLFSSTFAGSGPDALAQPTDVAVDQRTHDVYVADPSLRRVEKFTSSGEFILMFGKGVDKTTGADVCTAASHDVCQPGSQGSGPGAFVGSAEGAGGETIGRLFLAVDDSPGGDGGVYVGDPGDNIVSKFSSEGVLQREWGVNGQLDGSTIPHGAVLPGPFPYLNENNEPQPYPAIDGIVVNSRGALVVIARREGIFIFEPDGAFAEDFPTKGYYGGAGPSFQPIGIAINALDQIYGSSFGLGGGIAKLSPQGVQMIGGFYATLPNAAGIGTDLPTGDVFISNEGTVREYDPFAGFVTAFGPPQLVSPAGVAIDSLSSNAYVADPGAGDVAVFEALTPEVETGGIENATHTAATLTGHVDPAGRGAVTECLFEYGSAAGEYTLGTLPCESPSPPFPSVQAVHARLSGLTPGDTYHYRLRAGNEVGTTTGPDQSFSLPFVTALQTESATAVTNTSVQLNGSYFAEAGLPTKYHFEYGKTSAYGHGTPVEEIPGTESGTQHLTAPVTGLVAGNVYHYRVVAENSLGVTRGEDKTVKTAEAPTIEGVSSSDLTAITATLHARINPEGSATTYHFEYGSSTSYGEQTQEVEIAGSSAELFEAHPIEVQLEGLERGITYHFRLVAENQWGSNTSEDQTFEFFPSPCPNSAVRQQTGTAYLPDCRAYELVSPGNAAGTLLFPGGPNPGTATSPSRFAYVGAYSSLPGAGETINTTGDLYVATRTDVGWTSKYIGLSGREAGCMGNPPANEYSVNSSPDKMQNWVLTDPTMSRFLDWADGPPITCAGDGSGTSDADWNLAESSNAPYLWGADGSRMGRLPTGFGSNPEMAEALDCPKAELNDVFSYCSSELTASADLSHLVYSTNHASFSEGGDPPGLTEAPGSAYDNNVSAGTTSLISLTPHGSNIPQDPAFALVFPKYEQDDPTKPVEVPGGREEYIRFPGISTDGSHILMSTATAATPIVCSLSGQRELEGCPSFTDTPLHLYMRIDDAVSFEIAEGRPVTYVGMTPDGTHVYFTSEEDLTGEYPDHEGASLYMWSAEAAEEGQQPLTLISKPGPGSPPETGNTGDCGASWVEKCGAMAFSAKDYAHQNGGAGGNGLSDNAIAENGDIYFYSPEQLDGERGVPGGQNLYDYREGRAQFVATLEPSGPYCVTHQAGGEPVRYCSNGPAVRMQVNPSDTRMALVTPAQLTSYNNSGHLEMYSYDPVNRSIVCDSCNPTGKPATSDVSASQDGLFMTDDGRTFFSTAEPLVPADTNEGPDVYEFVDGRPQLITPGTGTVTLTGENIVTLSEIPGLVGVSANGIDVYFSTYDTLVNEDHNGSFLKFYDARTSGGFLQETPAQPCAAAEECHGPGTESPHQPVLGTGATLSGGNEVGTHSAAHRKRAVHRKHHAKKKKAHRVGKRKQGSRRHENGDHLQRGPAKRGRR